MTEKQSNGHLQNRLLAAIPPRASSLFKSDLRASGLASIWRLEMPRYYLHLSDERCVTDPYGTVLPDKNAALSHALVVARELMFNSTRSSARDDLLGLCW